MFDWFKYKFSLTTSTQQEFVLKMLKKKKGQGITSLEMFDYGVTRLSGQIFALREKGYKIQSIDDWCYNRYGTPVRYVRYVLVGEEK